MMTESTVVRFFKTEELDADTRNAIVNVCVMAHQEEDFKNLFSYVPSGGWHFLAFQGEQLVSHAMVTTRWLQPEGHPLLKTAYIDAVATLPGAQGHGHGSTLMRHLASGIDGEYIIGCLETERMEFYERLGWEVWRGPLAGRNEQGLIPTPEQKGIMILRLSQTPALYLDATLTIECQEARIW
ncbi:MAG TPA: GNAT family N-acetyltransferase [Anaerolineales bacterium]|nr:GNAT family N-acetyltransferase [Anaerolineales bacterium]